jgi:inosine-uridine nucleoside N-ribohydrolase
VTELAFFQKLAQRQRHLATDTLAHAVAFYATFYSGLYRHVAKTPGCFAHDLLAFIYLVNPEFFAMETGCIRVACEGLAQGQTILNRRDFIDYPQSGWEENRTRSQVCMEVDAPACLTLLEATLMADWLKN